ncbi:hemicentin-1-like [Glandiceps talaboti]
MPDDTLVISGDSTQLNCTFDLKPTLYAWYDDDGVITFVENTLTPRGKHELDSEGNVYNLRINNTTVSDEGLYECVDIVTLNRAEAYVYIVSSIPLCQAYTSELVTEGEEVTYECIIDIDENAPGDLVWYDVEKGIERHRQPSPDNTWTTNATRNDNGALLNCRLEHHTLPKQKWSMISCNETIPLEVQYFPSISIDDESNGKVIEGDSYTGECIVDANPPADVHWLYPPNVTVTVQDTLLIIDNADRHHAVNYTCIANNTLFNNDTGNNEFTFTIDVQFGPTVSVVDNSHNKYIIEGDQYTATCTVDANPKATVQWLFDDEPIHDGNMLEVVTTKDHSGEYKCEASNTFWNNRIGYGSDVTFLDVQYNPVITIHDSSNGTVIEGYKYTAYCSVDANPEATIQWLYDGHIFSEGELLVIDNARLNSTGNYTCEATNTFWNDDIGFGNETIYVIVQPSTHSTDIFTVTPDDTLVIFGESTQINCSFEIKPPFHGWYKDSTMVTNGDVTLNPEKHDLDSEGNAYNIRVHNTTFDDEGVYECFDLTSLNSAEASLYIVSNIPLCQVHPGNLVIEGEEVMYECTINLTSSAPGDLVWYDVNKGEEKCRQPSPNNTFTTTARRDDNGALLNCRLEHHTLPRWKWSLISCNESIPLEVQYFPNISIDDESNGKVIEGDSYTAECIVDANPPADVYWLYPSNVNVTVQDTLLTIDNADRNHAVNYTCVANNTLHNGDTGAAEFTVTLGVQFSPKVFITENSQDGYLVEGDEYNATCFVDANPEAAIQWLLNGIQFQEGPSLSILTTSNHTGNYTCEASNTFWNNDTGYDSASTYLDVHYHPVISIDDDSSGKVIEGDSYTAECIVDANPPADVYWLYPSNVNVTVQDTLLIIGNADRHHAVNYTCVANNTLFNNDPGADSYILTLDVQFGPSVNIDDNSYGGYLTEGDQYIATCNVDANPEAIIHWLFNGVLLKDGPELELTTAKNSSGNYTCEAFNTFWNEKTGYDNDVTYLDVHYHPVISIDDDSSGKVIEGDSYTAECIVDANPPADVYWLYPSNVNVTVEDTLLIIGNADRHHAVNYTCVANNTLFNNNTGNDSYILTLDVQFGPSVNIDDNSYGGYLAEGDQYIATCNVEANPEAIIHWLFNGEFLKDGPEVEITTAKNSSGNYTCEAFNTFWNEKTGYDNDVTYLDVHYHPVISIDDESNGKVIEGDSYTAECIVDANPPADVYWLYPSNVNVTVEDTSLEIDNADRHHAVNYTCVANNTLFNNDTAVNELTMALDVQFGPTVTIGDNSNEGYLIEGDWYVANCSVDANPEATIEWLFNDEVIHIGPELEILTTKDDSGDYTCEASTKFWNDDEECDSDVTSLDVQYKPRVTIDDESNGRVIEGKDFEADCIADANPDADIRWVYDGEIYEEAKLTIEDASRDDAKLYSCEALNTFWNEDEGYDNITLYLDVQYNPNVTIHDTSDGKVIEGYQYTANCSVDANPEATIQWLYDGEVYIDGEILIIDNADRVDTGGYTCEAYNTFWDEDTGCNEETIFIDVQYNPNVSIHDTNNGKVIEGDKYIADCTVDANPEASILWLYNGEIISEESELEIDDIEREQAGNYTCEAYNIFWNGEEGYDNSTTYLDVQYNPVITIHDSSNGRVIEGCQYAAYCSVDANPEATIQWLYDGEVYSEGEMLIIENTSRADSGLYTCEATNTFWDENKGCSEETIYVDIQYNPNVSIHDTSNGKVIEGDKYIADCTVDANPEASIHWLYNGEIISEESELEIDDIEREQAGNYTCEAYNIFWNGEEGYGNSTTYLDVQYNPVITIHDSSNGRVIEGCQYAAYCSVDANPEATIQWLYDGEVYSEGEMLIIENTSRADSGLYTCEATNTFWDENKGCSEETIYVDIQYNPNISIHDTSNGKVIEGDKYIADCTVDANPEASSHWLYNGEIISEESELEIDDIEREQAGNYTCEAYNIFWNGEEGYDNSTTYLDVQYPPSVDVSTTYDVLKEGEDTTLYCYVRDGNPIDVTYTWHLTDQTEVNNHLVNLYDVTRQLHGHQECIATNVYYDGREGTGSNSTFLDVQYSPEVDNSTVRCKEGEIVTLNCEVASNPEPSIYEWTKDNDPLSNDQSLIINNPGQGDTGDYLCTAGNIFYDNTTGIGRGVTELTVEYLSTIEMTVYPSNVVFEGDSVNIDCIAQYGEPMPYKMTLLFDDIVISEVDGSELKYEIADINRSESGTYHCQAVTLFYDDTEGYSFDEIDIVVQYHASIVDDPGDGDEIHTEIGGQVTMNCSVDAVPLADIQWFDNSNDTITNCDDVNKCITSHEPVETIVSSTLTVTVVDDSYYGFYTCKAENVIIVMSAVYRSFEIVRIPGDPDDVDATAVGVTIAIVLVIIAVIILVVIFIYRQKQKQHQDVFKVNTDGTSSSTFLVNRDNTDIKNGIEPGYNEDMD